MKMRTNTNTRSKVVGTPSSAPARSSPIRWWRIVAAQNFHPPALRAMWTAASMVEIIGEARWRSAIEGDAACAIAIVLSLNLEDSSLHKFDLAMTALVVCAGDGSAAACLVLAHVIRRLPGAGRREARLATSWLVRASRPLLDRGLSGAAP
jgi:hypothetical protein